MKKFIILLISVLFLTSCAEKKTFTRKNGTSFTAQPYGWMNQEKEIDNVVYDVCAGNVILSIVFSETIVVPVILTGTGLWEPIEYNEPVED